ncbi:ABC-2 type transport system ATP-binding protein [Methanomicrobium sp. W14]|uniref:ABC transporter ATP-binding protein n=1 Tax=Methanomicrobium sp. W14 TaxID=2817839 RepID=UPI001AE236D9|nr:ABC transporter ATP-binding protein [Methanomicrobium sp. W14]MBP2133551.1 ABC-2 type transport system ATP-binding protein [Methanomicrobium sp. W14]
MEQIILVSGLKKTFGKKPVLSGISFDVNRGEVFGFLGPNGAGKTTTMRILLGLLKPDSGKAFVFGEDLGVSDSSRSRVGVLMENNGLFENFTPLENLEYYAGIYGVPDAGKRIEYLLELTDLEAEANAKVGSFSTGMKRKLGIARAILHSPEVLFLDEPTSALDPQAQKMVRDLIQHLANDESMTVFLSSHNLDEVQKICSRVAILHGGEIKALDSVENLRRGSEGRRVRIKLSDVSKTDKAFSLIAGNPEYTGFQETGGGFSVNLHSGSASPLICSLCSAGVGIEEVLTDKRSLEDIYIEIMKEEA